MKKFTRENAFIIKSIQRVEKKSGYMKFIVESDKWETPHIVELIAWKSPYWRYNLMLMKDITIGKEKRTHTPYNELATLKDCFDYIDALSDVFEKQKNNILDAIDRVLARGGVCEVEIPHDEIENIDEYLSKIDRVGWMWNPKSTGIEVYRASQANKYAA